MEYSEVDVNKQLCYFLLTQYAIYIDCISVPDHCGSKALHQHPSASSHTLYCVTECVSDSQF